MFRDYFKMDGKTYERISKDYARKMFNAGKTIACIASKLNPMYGNGMFLIPVNMGVRECGFTFDRMESEFRYYNCNQEAGGYIRFYSIK